jgi:hypothetical protein
MSGTKARRLAFDKKKDAFYTAVGYPPGTEEPAVETAYARIREWFPRHLDRKDMDKTEKTADSKAFNAKHPKKGGNDEDTSEESYPSAFAADAEPKQPKAGRRRTYRRCRKCGLPKKPETQ